MANYTTDEDLREIIKIKAEKHREYYKNLTDFDAIRVAASRPLVEMAPQVTNTEDSEKPGDLKMKRQRRTGVYEIKNYHDGTIFKSVKLLRENYLAMLQKTVNSFQREEEKPQKDQDDSLLLPPTSGYCSSTASGVSDDEREDKGKVQRCGSSDSAMGQSDDENNWREKKDEVPYQKPVHSPYSPRGSIDHDNVPSKTLIEAQFVPYPVGRKGSDGADRKCSDCDRKCSDCVSDGADYDRQSDSRRQSCFTDDGEEQPRYRYWRTPSVVVSDYSDDIMGLTLEDIEYIRNHRKENSSSPDSSLHSSCSNINYCGSTISSLESEFVFRKPFRKSSNCSTCSTLSGDEETDGLQPPIKCKEM
ncbi:hypothetical protein BDFB_005799 [Asbolus verrucosus]|uniref:Uncharacterized protein n=1 Tax=Asbolus verrucosus TaxID=1661398 RepID=A0A482VEG7_ASBVE|nr:hypothetical protein BDFB_005799 [Asbolus verrucosus]